MVTAKLWNSNIALVLVFITSVQLVEGKGVLKGIYRKAVKSHKPFILVLDNSNAPAKSADLFQQLSKVQGQGIGPYFAQITMNKNDSSKLIVSYPEQPEDDLLKPKNIPKKSSKLKDIKNPIVKSILRISNRIMCQARDECDDSCGATDDECKDDCEEDFECEEEPDPCAPAPDPCGGSTKGYVSEEPQDCGQC